MRVCGVRTSANESSSALPISVGGSEHGTSTCYVSRTAHFVSDGGGGASESSVRALSGVKARGTVGRQSSDSRSVTRSASAILGIGETVVEPSRVERTDCFGSLLGTHEVSWRRLCSSELERGDDGGHGEQQRLRQRSKDGSTSVREYANGKKATAAVMRYGYGRGVFFEGCETRRGKRRRQSPDIELRLGRQERSPGNTTNPLWH